MEIELIFSAFFAVILTFLAPCTLPLVPAYLSIISGVSVDKLGERPDAKALRRQVVLNGFYFMAGFSLVFVGFGILAGLFGTIIAPYRTLFTQVGGAIIILFGLIMLGVFKIPFLERVWKPQIHQSPKATKKMPLLSAQLLLLAGRPVLARFWPQSYCWFLQPVPLCRGDYFS